MDAYYAQESNWVVNTLGSSEKEGLTTQEAEVRLERYGPNRFEMGKPTSALKIFLSQFTDFLVIILMVAAAASFLVGYLPGQKSQIEDAILILLIVLFNGIFGFIQDYKAEKSIEALKNISVSKAKVLRNSRVCLIDPAQLVPGDIVLLETGEKVPADIRLLEANELDIDESILTGESVPVSKLTRKFAEGVPLAERRNLAFMSTIITRGMGKGIVFATGKATEVGKIAEEIFKTSDKRTPFTIELDRLGKRISYLILGLIAAIAVFQLVVIHVSPFMILMIAISLGVAAIPEGLPAVVTLAMAIGTRKMLKQKALVRKLSVVESLGSVDVICTDKTGTLTENRMTVRRIYFNKCFYEVTGVGYEPEGEFMLKGKSNGATELKPLLEVGLNCNDATLGADESGNEAYIGDPTEIALVVAAKKAGLEERFLRVGQIPFSSETKIMVTVHEALGRAFAFLKGAPEMVLEKCIDVEIKNKRVKLSKKIEEEFMEANSSMAGSALRVLAFAIKELKPGYSKHDLHSGYTLLGLQGMIDPPREGVKESIAVCKNAGITVKMLTGDNLLTAKAIASEIGLGTKSVNGPEIDAMSDEELSSSVEGIDIFARVSPANKVRILKALQGLGHTVAMTGDGVNDAPALKNSDVGIGMGVRGSDLAKEVSDMILLDDNFNTIKNSIEEGRTIFYNIRKFVTYLLSSNIEEVLVVFILSLFGKLALVPVQLLWINLLTDGLPALALGVDPKLPDTMKKPPVKRGEGIINRRVLKMIFAIGILLTMISIPLFFIGLKKSLIVAQTMLFTAFVVYEMLRIVAIRSQEKLSFFSNKWLLGAMATSLGLQLIVLYTGVGKFFGVVPLGLFEWGVILGLGSIGFLISIAVLKFMNRER